MQDIHTDSPFRLLEKINEGSQGCIYRGINIESKEKVVMKKVSKKKGSSRIRDEIRANEMLNTSPGACLFHGHIETSEHVVSVTLTLYDVSWRILTSLQYLINEHVQGMDLFTLLESRKFKPLSEAFVKKIASQIAKTIQNCHDQGIAHRDIKLENVSLIFTDFSMKFLTGDRWCTTLYKIEQFWSISACVRFSIKRKKSRSTTLVARSNISRRK